MTDPGDLATTDSNDPERTDLPAAKTERLNPGIGEDEKDTVLRQHEKDQGKLNSQNPDPLDL
ncbi:hypothetical protein DEDE109153_10920 [Deinococcus deserti]|uniref:Uncharacterized protein n=1 Tax=Deinococcus deserti (strain DSM 17065 / CIP 109153 / LMG 22923 / VCD115) TaxID=546414 RepID=C1CX83_DEIDV|nr:hypothetical protein [Deinococcus deserti]ACO46800.1 hypothetical protein Deide_18130 [Deinococcus deserti VCD115]